MPYTHTQQIKALTYRAALWQLLSWGYVQIARYPYPHAEGE